MKKLFVLVSCFVVVFVLSKIGFAQEAATPVPVPDLSLEEIIGEAHTPVAPYALPFGTPPYLSVDGYPAYGIPYSYPRGAARAARIAQRPRRLIGRFVPPPYQPYPLPAPGAVPGMLPPPVYAPGAVPPPAMVQPTFLGQVPCQGMLGPVPAVPAPPSEPPVFYRPTPIKNFMTLITAPRPYIGYDPYVGYPPFPGYIPPQ